MGELKITKYWQSERSSRQFSKFHKKCSFVLWLVTILFTILIIFTTVHSTHMKLGQEISKSYFWFLFKAVTLDTLETILLWVLGVLTSLVLFIHVFSIVTNMRNHLAPTTENGIDISSSIYFSISTYTKSLCRRENIQWRTLCPCIWRSNDSRSQQSGTRS